MDYIKHKLMLLVSLIITLTNCHSDTQKIFDGIPILKAEQDFIPQGIIGRVLIFNSESRIEEVTDLSMVQKIYCRAYPYPKASQKVGSNPNYRLGLWQGSDCSFAERSSCKNFYLKEGEIQSSDWLHQEYVDFVIETKTLLGVQDSDEKFYVILSGGPLFEQRLSISFPLAFNVNRAKKPITEGRKN